MMGTVVFRGAPNQLGERFSQRGRGGAGGFADGRGPGDVGVRADQEGVGWPVIGFGGVDVDAMLPVPGGLAEVWAVGEVEEDGPCGVHEFRDAGGALSGVQGEVGCEGAGQGVLAGAGHRVADVGAGDKGSDAAQWLLVGEQFLEEFPKRLGGWVLSAPQCHLSLGLQQVHVRRRSGARRDRCPAGQPAPSRGCRRPASRPG